MAKPHATRTVFIHRSFRIDEGVLKTLEQQAETTGWSASKLANAWLAAARDHLAGIKMAMPSLLDRIKSAEDLELARQKTEAVLAPLRKKAAEARKALAPLVQKINAARPHTKRRKAA